MTTEPDELLTLDDLLRILRVKRSKLYELVREMPTIALGRGVRVRRSALDAWLAERESPPARPRR